MHAFLMHTHAPYHVFPWITHGFPALSISCHSMHARCMRNRIWLHYVRAHCHFFQNKKGIASPRWCFGFPHELQILQSLYFSCYEWLPILWSRPLTIRTHFSIRNMACPIHTNILSWIHGNIFRLTGNENNRHTFRCPLSHSSSYLCHELFLRCIYLPHEIITMNTFREHSCEFNKRHWILTSRTPTTLPQGTHRVSFL